MSDKILYSEVKAEKSFLALINAAVSHELRNPLSSLIGNIESIQNYFESFKTILSEIKDP
jgi:signal transduction histidine kinase